MRLVLTHAYPFPCPPDSYSQDLAADNCLNFSLSLKGVAAVLWTHTLVVDFVTPEAAQKAAEATLWEPISPTMLEAKISRTEGYDSHPAIVVVNCEAIEQVGEGITSEFVAFCGMNVVAD